MKPQPLWIVLTGGPCAGKTTALNAIAKHFDGRVSIAAEAATQVFANRPTPTPSWTIDDWHDLQYAITRQQLTNEYRAQYQSLKCGYPLVVCDRAPYDNLAYPAGQGVVRTMASANQVRPMNAYGLVIHLSSLAVAAPHRYSCASNASRYESLKEAKALDERTLAAWSAHPNRVILKNTGTLNDTVKATIRLINVTLAGHQGHLSRGTALKRSQ
jgi:predicted ATPase